MISGQGQTYFLRGNFICVSPHVHLLVGVHAGKDEEDSWAPGTSYQQPAQSEDDGPLVLLDHLHHEEEREWEEDENETH